MANPNFLDPLVRKQIINEIKSFENVERKNKSFKSYEIFNDNAEPYVFEELSKQLSVKTAQQMPIISNLNIAKAVVNKEATIYTDCPERDYEDILEADEEVLETLYEDCGFDTILGKANKYYKLRNQTFVQVVPKDGVLKLRMLHPHNIDVVPDSNDPEKAFAYIVSGFDKSYYLKASQDNVNQTVAEADDYKANAERFQVFTAEYIFTMDGKGNVVSEIIENPIGIIPIIDISKDKDFEFFVRIGQALTDFTIDFNVAWSDLMYIARMQGYSVGVLSGDPNLKPDNMIIGPNRFLFLPSNPANPESKMELDFKSPSPNIEAQLKAIESLVTTFLTTRGLDSKAVSISNGGASFSSALERLISMIDQFRATKDDFDLFRSKEKELHTIVVKYLALLSGSDLLNKDLWVSQSIVDSKLTINFSKPEMIETKSEMLANAKTEIDLGIEDAVSVKAKIDGISEDQAKEEIDKILMRKQERMTVMANSTNGSESSDNEDMNADSENQS